MKRQPDEWEKTFVNNISNKGLISNVYKELIQLGITYTHTHTHTQLKKGRDLNIHFSEENIQMASGNIKQFLATKWQQLGREELDEVK